MILPYFYDEEKTTVLLLSIYSASRRVLGNKAYP